MFDKLNTTWKISSDDPEIMEILFLEKYHRTHDEYLNTPKRIIDLMLLKRWSDAKAEKRNQKSLSIKKK